MENKKNLEYLDKYYSLKSIGNSIDYLSKKIKRIRAHVNPFKFLDKHQFEGFKNNNPIIIDIGCAKAEFIFELYKKLKNYNFIGFEVRPLMIKYLEQEFEKYKNIIFFSGNAQNNLINIIEPNLKKNIKIEYIFINFPDPWIKTKHIKRRIINKEFLNQIYQLFEKYNVKTKIIIQTDVDFMFNDIKEQIINSKYEKYTLFDKPIFNIQTKWEIDSIKKKKTIYRLLI